MKRILLSVMGICCAFISFAQTNQLTGKVVDASNNSPLVGAVVEAPGIGGVTTNEFGEFNISCSDSVQLKVSFIGFETFEKKVSCQRELTISLFSKIMDIDAVEITATANPDKSPLEQPRSIVKLRETELKRSTGLFLDDALNTSVPGVRMERRTLSAGQQINIRGYGNGMGFRGISSNFDSQGLKLYLNGIPVTDAEGITMMDDIDFGSLSNVEVIKGPSGTLYGLAIAGVVNLQTQKAAKDEVSIGEEVLLGSYGLLRSTTRVTLGGKNSSVLVNYGHQKFDGFMPHTASSKDFLNMMGDFALNERQSLSTYFGYSNSYDERNGELTIKQYEDLDYSGNARYIANDAHSAIRSFRAGIGHTYKFNDNISNTTSFFGSSQSIDQSSAGGWTDKYPVSYGLRSTFDKRFKLSDNISLSGITGIEMQKTNAFNAGYGMSADSTNPDGYNVITSLKSNQATISSTYSYFTKWTLGLPKDFSFSAGVGVSNTSLRLEDRLWGLGNNTADNKRLRAYEADYTNLVSPSFAINKKFGKAASVYASYSVGYKAPVSSNILISTTGQLNTGLVPEKGAQIEIGTKGSMCDNKLFYTVAIFNARFEDKFTAIAVQNPSNTATLYSYVVNGGNVNNNGLEALVRYNLVESNTGFIKLVRPFANLSYSDFSYGDFKFGRVGKDAGGKDSAIVEDYTGNVVAGVAPLVYNIGLDADTKIGLYGNVYYNYRSAMYFTSDEKNEADAYGLLNAKLGFRKAIKHFDLNVYVGANNITGAQYYQMVFVNQLPDAYIPGPNEINFFSGLGVKYNF